MTEGISKISILINGVTPIAIDWSECITIKELVDEIFDVIEIERLEIDTNTHNYDDENSYYTKFIRDRINGGYNRIKVPYKYNSDGDQIAVLPVSDDTLIGDILSVHISKFGTMEICHYSDYITIYEEK